MGKVPLLVSLLLLGLCPPARGQAASFTPTSYTAAVLASSPELRQAELAFSQARNAYRIAVMDAALPAFTLSLPSAFYGYGRYTRMPIRPHIEDFLRTMDKGELKLDLKESGELVSRDSVDVIPPGRGDIMLQFIVEAVMLGMTPSLIKAWMPLVSVFTAAMTAFVFAIYPAWVAAGLKPAEALRAE